MEDYTMKMSSAKQKPYDQGRSETEMEPTLTQLVKNLENQSRTMNNMSRELNDSIFSRGGELDGNLDNPTDQLTLMERLNKVVTRNYQTALNMEILLDKVKGVE